MSGDDRLRDLRSHLRALADRRQHLVDAAYGRALAPDELREYRALIWALRLLRYTYAGLTDALVGIDLSFHVPGVEDEEDDAPDIPLRQRAPHRRAAPTATKEAPS
ncbi:MAG: hypothetical protein ACREM3_27965 [Candidatus Rokuibacteriota bacterium]